MNSRKFVRNSVLGITIIALAIAITFVTTKPTATHYDPSVNIATSKAFSKPLETLDKAQKRKFILGKNLFHGISNDHRTPEQRGIGPLFNAKSCGECHGNDGTSDPETTPSLLTKLFNSETKDSGDPNYGVQVQDQSTPEMAPEASIDVNEENEISFSELSKGELALDTIVYQRIAPAVFGMGLIEAIPNSFFQEMADPQDKNNDGISGRIPYIEENGSKTKTIGRFGWKSTVKSVKDQSLTAAFEDIGLTNSKFLPSDCFADKECVHKSDMSTTQEDNIVAYVRSLAPPRSRELNKQSKKGEKLFTTLSCSACHTQSIKLEESDLVVNKNTVIHPMSDFLLHSMGKNLADRSDMYGRKADEFRTAPLWGLGLKQKVNGSLNLLHDGRAKTIDQAIRNHGGEAKAAKGAYDKLSKADKQALIAYLNTL